MHDEAAQDVPVRTKAVLVDAASMRVVWMNEAASAAVADRLDEPDGELSVDDAVPMAAALGVAEALRSVAESGVAQHLQADIVSTSKGAMALVVSLYRMPDGNVLALAENTWQMGPKSTPGRSRRPGRQPR